MERLLPTETLAQPALPWHIAIVGPTASGKTAAALAVARVFDVEIISVDSALVYRGMDIGTAKPGAAELAQVPHHLINIRDPLLAYSAAEFARDAKRLMGEITARGRLPLLVGGTMLYLKALWDGLDDLPPANPVVRADIEQQAAHIGWPGLHEKLKTIDPVTAARLSPNDSQRIARALEVFELTGAALSSFFTSKSVANSSHIQLEKLLISLEPVNRVWLHERIAQRFDAMLQNGLVDEVKTLRTRGDLHADLPSMRCVGYRQVWQALEDGMDERLGTHECSPQQLTQQWAALRDKGIAATRQLAKRQITWLRSLPGRQTVAADGPDPVGQVLEIVSQVRPPLQP